MKEKLPALSPSQSLSFEAIKAQIDDYEILTLWTRRGYGRTTILKHLKKTLGANMIGMRLIVDNFHLILSVGQDCYSDPRGNLYDVIGQAIVTLCNKKKCKLILGTNGGAPVPIRRNSYLHGVGELTPEDYKHTVDCFGLKKNFDVEEVHRFAPRLNFYQLSEAAQHCVETSQKTTQAFIDYLSARQLASNVELAEVKQVGLADLVGVDELVASGKALAHRLRGKFFLIDGTFISGTEHFYHNIAQIFEQAKANAPSVIFIDDSDVIFESGQEHGLYRYLLTMLDGLESESSGRVCVMLTAMDIRHIPPALIRSGRVELWLETQLPDQPSRAILIENLVSNLDLASVEFDIDEIAMASEGCTPADLKRLINEAKTQYAWDESRGKELRTLTDYTIESINSLKQLKQKYEDSRKLAGSENRPVWFDVATP